MDQPTPRSLSRLFCLATFLLPALAGADPALIKGNMAVGPLRKDLGDGICATLVHIKDPPNPPFAGTMDAIGKLNLPVGQGMIDDKQSRVFHHARFHNSESSAVGDFRQEVAELFPYESNFAARIRGYVNVDPVDIVYTNAVYAVAGARLRIGGVPLIEFNSGVTVRQTKQVRYSMPGLYPVELIYYANGGIAVLEASAAPSAEPEGPQLSLDTSKFHLIQPTQLYTARVGSTTACIECSDDTYCSKGNYCAHDWGGGGPGPDGTCQPCLVNNHCGPTCMACAGATPICDQGKCVQCEQDDDCPSGQRCDSGNHTCMAAPPCNSAADCPMGETCDPDSHMCAVPCASDAACPMGLLCDPGKKICTRPCTNDTQCRQGYICSTDTHLCLAIPPHYVGGGCTAAPGARGVPAALLLGAVLAGLVLLRRRRAAKAGAVAFFFLLAGEARADLAVNALTFHPAIGPDNVIVVEGTRTPGTMRPIVEGLLEYDHLPLRLIDASGNTLANTVPDALVLHLMGGLGVTRWLAFAADVPIVLYQGFGGYGTSTMQSQPSVFGITDIRVWGKARIINNSNGGFGLAFVPQVTFPSGKGSDLRGDDSYDIEPRFAVDYKFRGGSFVAINVGFLGRTSNQVISASTASTLGVQEIGSQFTYGVGGSLALPRGFSVLLDLSGRASVQSLTGGSVYAPTELHGGLRWVHSSGLTAMAGLGGGFTDAVGSPQVRAFAAFGWMPVSWGQKAPPIQALTRIPMTVYKSGSGTGVVSSSPGGIDCGKDCAEPFEPGTEVVLTAHPGPDSTFVGWSGPCSGTDPCIVRLREPVQVGVEFAHRAEPRATFSVDKSGEGTGVVTSEPTGIHCGTTCLTTFRVGQMITLHATPDDGSWFSGWEGPCSGTGDCTVSLSGATTVRAKFNKRQLEVKENKIDLKGNVIHFESGKADIQPDSFVLLDEIVAILRQNPDMRLKIEGHTDNVPFRGKGGNQRLSQDRAQSVADYLVSHGIAAQRLSSAGYGETCPIAPNKTRDGRTLNRRTEFWILKPGEAPAKECQAKAGAGTPVQGAAPAKP